MENKTVIVAPLDGADKTTVFDIKPDYVCKGKDDHIIIQKALDVLGTCKETK